MADDGLNTIRELINGFNSMQASLGLSPLTSTSIAQAGGPTPFAATTPGAVAPLPTVKHPGQFSQEATSQIAQQAQSTVQVAQQIRMTPAPGVLGLSPVAAASNFSSQFQANMGQIQGQYVTPQTAQFFAQGMGQPGFANIPNPIYQTPASMGIYRPNMMTAPPVGLARQEPFMRTPFTPNLPTPMFQQPWEMQYNQQRLMQEQMFASAMAVTPTVSNLAVTGAAGAAGMHFGGQLATHLGGAPWRRLGRLGGLAGGVAMGAGVLGRGAEWLTEQGITNPLTQTRGFGLQLQQMSRQFVVGGNDLNPITGQGLSTEASMRLANRMQRDIENRQTPAGFNMRDMMRITQQAAQSGMLDFAQNSEQIASQVRNVARGLQSFMQIAQEPDIRKAIQQMSTFRSMGLNIHETNIAQQNAVRFARMAGLSPQGLAEAAGLPGAMMFQQAGYTAGLGYQVGGAARGMAGQAVAGGAFSPAQLSMAGGVSGVSQTLTETAAAGLGVDFPLMATLTRGSNGQLTVDPRRLRQIMTGQMSLQEQAQMAGSRIQELGGESAITELSTRMNELRDELGRKLGPQGSVLYSMRQAANVMQQVPELSFGAALSRLGLNAQQARSVELMGQSPQFWENLRQQHDVNIQQMRGDEARRRAEMRRGSTLTGQLSEWWNRRGPADRMREMGTSIMEDISTWWTDRTETAAAAEQGAQYVARNRAVEARSAEEQAAVQRYASQNVLRMSAQNRRGVATTGQTAAAYWNVGLGAAATAAGLLTGPLGGIAAGLGADLLSSNAPQDTIYSAALQARGGASGALARWMPSLLVSSASSDEQRRAYREAIGAAEVGSMISTSQRMNMEQVKRVSSSLRSAAEQYSRTYGGPEPGKARDYMHVLTRATSELFEEAASWKGDRAVTSAELKQRWVQKLTDSGTMSQDAARAFVEEKFTSGLGAAVMARTKPLLSKKAKAAWAKSEEAQGFIGKVAGANLKETQDIAEKAIDDIKEKTGFYTGFDATKEEWAALEKQLTTGAADETLLLTAIAAGGEEKERILRTLKDKYGVDKVDDMLADAEKKYERLKDTGQAGMFERFGKILGEEEMSYEDLTKTVSGFGKTIREKKGQVAMGRGAAKYRYAAFGKMYGGGTIEDTMKAFIADPTQREGLAQDSPELARLLDEYEKAESPEAKRQATLKFQERLIRKGGGRSGGTFGGKGVGGEEEGRETALEGIEEDIQTAIKKGRAGEAFAKSVPLFSKTIGELHDVTKELRATTEAARTALKLQ